MSFSRKYYSGVKSGVKIIMEVKAGVRISLILGLLKNKYCRCANYIPLIKNLNHN